MELSIVCPIYNEEESVSHLYVALIKSLDKLNKSFEIILVDDGSKDRSFDELKKLQEKDPRVKVIKFRRNFGQTAAMSAGFDYAQGDIIISMDADLQNDPEDFEKLIDKMNEGYDVVSGWRKDRKDKTMSRKIPSKIANKLISKLTGVHLHDYGCSLKAYKSKVIKNVYLYGEMHRFIPAICSMIGAKIVEVPVKHHPRKYGVSKYGISRTIRVVLDLITVRFLQSYMTRPIQIFGKLGLYSIFMGLIFFILTLYMKFGGTMNITGNPFFVISIFSWLAGLQLIVTGLLAEIQTRVYYEGQKKSIYVIDEIVSVESFVDQEGEVVCQTP
ncbi:glycosyltransferase family 2 protein [Paenibacillus sp. Y412MC10]|uniref:glycosyltransferase family 2 protein n=1 Tax=Geobacillus sp. (strain Y412MC10) TaxID=481743 RepID=UPI0011A82A90|nr:glycosyltransferase family 2 protein [Paenibacillus sp. Y412MC10]